MIVVLVVLVLVVVTVMLVVVVGGTVYVGWGSGTQTQVTGSQNMPGILLLQLKSTHS